MNELQYLSVGYALFVLLIVGEAALGWWRGRYVYRVGEAVVNVGHGMVFQVADLFTKALFMAPFVWLSARSAPHLLPLDAWWAWLIGLFAYDFCTYWRHRHHHEVNFLWAVHSCHHAAEDFNFAGALRQALFGNVLGWLWTLPLALVMPMEMFVGIIVFDYIYQFIQHTRHVPKLGPIEWLMNTPSHHRVHHGTEAKYLDRNYGGIFIIWDRLFGTFQVEQEEPTYGVTQPLGTLNPVWANLLPWVDLWRWSRSAASFGDRLKVWLVGPGRTKELVAVDPPRPRGELENSGISRPLMGYVLTTFTLNVAVLVALIWAPEDRWGLRLGIGALVWAGAALPGALLEQKPWAWRAETVRVALLLGVATLLNAPPLVAEVLLVAGVLAMVLMAWARRGGQRNAGQDGMLAAP